MLSSQARGTHQSPRLTPTLPIAVNTHSISLSKIGKKKQAHKSWTHYSNSSTWIIRPRPFNTLKMPIQQHATPTISTTRCTLAIIAPKLPLAIPHPSCLQFMIRVPVRLYRSQAKAGNLTTCTLDPQSWSH